MKKLPPINEVHVYVAPLNFINKSNYNEIRSFLSEKEEKHLSSFRNQNDLKRFILARYVVRTMLVYYTDINFKNIDFVYTSYGKPTVKISGQNIDFSIAHSNNLVIVAFSQRSVGIDIELIQNRYMLSNLVLTPTEQRNLNNLPNALAKKMFFSIWTNKESYIKAIGMGLFFPINSIIIKFGKKINRITDLNGNINKKYFLKDISIFNNHYSAALTTVDQNSSVKIFNFIKYFPQSFHPPKKKPI